MVIVRVRAVGEMEMGMRPAGQLPNDVKKPEENERAPRNPRKPAPNPIAQRDPEPGDEQAEQSGETRVPGGSRRRDRERLRPTPALGARGEHERQPVRRDGGVEKRDAETSDRNGGENGVVHWSR